jgi:hypothetical protein
VLQVENVTIDEKHLGLPTPDGRMKKERFKSTKERLAKKCSSWAERYMSGGGGGGGAQKVFTPPVLPPLPPPPPSQRSVDQVSCYNYSYLCDGRLQAPKYTMRRAYTVDPLLLTG